VLFDEIEKAHSDVFNLLLQILEDGTLTDSQGRRVDFSNSIIIMTSNIGSQDADRHKILGFSETVSEYEAKVKESEMLSALRQRFRPEFLNRIDDILFFDPLGRDTLERIAKNMLLEIEERGKRIGVALTFSSEIPRLLVRKSFSSAYGARPLRRAIIRLIEDPLSMALLEKQFQKGDCIDVSVNAEDRIILNKKP
jgi:ATP-dependent Clp protease ATP-binding subunit ClpC